MNCGGCTSSQHTSDTSMFDSGTTIHIYSPWLLIGNPRHIARLTLSQIAL
jgi:hypothetical protein